MAGAELKQQRSVTYNSSHSETISGAIRRSGTTGNTSLAAVTKSSAGGGGGVSNIGSGVYNSRNISGGISSGSRSVDSLGDHSISQRTADTSDTGGAVSGSGTGGISGSSLLSSSIGGGSRSTCRAGASSNDALISQHGSHIEIVVDSTKLENNSGVGTAIGRSIRIGSINRRSSTGIGIGTGESSIEELEPGDEESAGGGQGGDGSGSGSKRKRVRHKHRPLFRRLISYIRGAFSSVHFSSSADSELEELEHLPPRYRPDSLSALCRATRFSEAEIKRIYRGFKAECPTGIIREDTFKIIYASFFPQAAEANTGLYAHYVFNTLDQDNSGIVSFEDFVQGLSVLSRGSVEEKLRWTFSLYDINGDGFITREEMTDIVTAIYELMGRGPDTCPDEDKIKEKVDRLFEKMDLNRDGVVTLDEFLDCCRNDETISRSINVFDSSF